MAEIGGIVLGIVPIIASTIQQYGSLYKMCRRYKKAHDGVEELLHCLEVQKVIFETETKLLLIVIIGPEKADVMMEQSGDKLWHDAEIAAKFDEALGDSKDAFVRVVRLAQTRMTKMEKEINELVGNVPSTGAGKPDRVSWIRSVKKRFSFAVSENRLASMATAIREMTTDHRVLSTQVRERLNLKSNRNAPNSNPSMPQDVKDTQSAAARVYKQLSAACQLHEKHRTCFGLNVMRSSTLQNEIQFSVAYHPTSTQDLQSSHASGVIPKWLTVVVDFADSATSGHLHQGANVIPKEPRFSKDIDLCTRLLSGPQRNGLIGWLEEAAECNMQVFLGSHPATVRSVGSGSGGPSFLSLSDTLRSQVNSTRRFTMVQRLKLAEIVSSAVLNLYATPWAQVPWTSHNLIIYDGVPTSTSKPLPGTTDIFLEASIQVPDNSIMGQKTLQSFSPFVPNQELFNLGVVLLELAFETPFIDMCTAFKTSQVCSRADRDISIETALWRSEEVSTCLGTKYAEVVKRCLRCDFGYGSDLATADLQNAFRDRVVIQIGDLEREIRQLGMV